MLYELHLTTEPETDVGTWEDVCHTFEVKPLVIQLSNGEHSLQVMMAAIHEGDDESVKEWCDDMIHSFKTEGFEIIRAKLEVPLDKSAPYKKPIYHEAHVKMLLTPQEVVRLKGADEFGAHISQNTLYTEFDKLEKWYLTMRAYDVAYRKAAEQFGDTFVQITTFLPGVRMEMETVVTDTNPDLDKGWAHA